MYGIGQFNETPFGAWAEDQPKILQGLLFYFGSAGYASNAAIASYFGQPIYYAGTGLGYYRVNVEQPILYSLANRLTKLSKLPNHLNLMSDATFLFEKTGINIYLIRDSVLEASVKLYGGRDLRGNPISTSAVICSISPVKTPAGESTEVDFDVLFEHLANLIVRQRKWSTIFLVYKGEIVYSTDKDAPKGQPLPKLQKIEAGPIALFPFWHFFKELKNRIRSALGS